MQVDFPLPLGPHNRHELSPVDGEIDMVQGDNSRVAGSVYFCNAVKPDQGVVFRRCLVCSSYSSSNRKPK